MAHPVRENDSNVEFPMTNGQRCQEILETIGKRLAHQRNAQETSIEVLAKDLRIRASLLNAAEQGNIKEFPGDSYYYGFARNYADALSLDISDDIKQYRALREQQEDRTYTDGKLADVVVNSFGDRTKIAAATIASTSNPLPNAGSLTKRSPREVLAQSSDLVQQMMSDSNPKTHNLAFVMIGGFVLVLGYVMWLVFAGFDTTTQSETPITAPTEELTDIDEILGSEESSVTETIKPQTNSVFRVSESVIQQREEAAAAVPAKPVRTGREYGNPVNSRVAIKAKGASWVSVVDISQVDIEAGRTGEIFARQLQTNDVYYAPIGDQLFVKAGDAGSVELLVDGTSRGVLGRKGQVRYSSLSPQSIVNGDNFKDGSNLNQLLQAIKRAQSR